MLEFHGLLSLLIFECSGSGTKIKEIETKSDFLTIICFPLVFYQSSFCPMSNFLSLLLLFLNQALLHTRLSS